MAPASLDKRRAAGGRGITADRRHQQTAKARAVKTTTEGNDGKGDKGNDGNFPKGGGRQIHNNQLSNKVAAAVRTVVAIYGR